MTGVTPLYDAVIVGAGPAGSALARQLARGGWRVRLVERESGFRDRVCGGFLGAEADALWRELGLKEAAGHLPKSRVSTLVLSGPRGTELESPVPGGGWGVDRAVYDAWLREHAAAAGADVSLNTRVTRLHQAAGLSYVRLERDGDVEEVRSRVVVRATGRRQRPSAASREPMFGCRTVYADASGTQGRVVLHFVRDGHVGLNHLPDGRTTMCLAIGRARLAAVRGQLDALMAQLAEENPAIARQLAGARRVAGWISCLADSDGREIFAQNGILHAGDAVTMLNPILGGGLSAAVGSSILLARQLLRAPCGRQDPAAVARGYAAAWRAHYAARARLGRWLGWCERSALISDGVLDLLSRRPAAASELLRRGRPGLLPSAVPVTG